MDVPLKRSVRFSMQLAEDCFESGMQGLFCVKFEFVGGVGVVVWLREFVFRVGFVEEGVCFMFGVLYTL